MKYQPLSWLLVGMISLVVLACGRRNTDGDAWPQQFRTFLEPQTYPGAEWHADDFGAAVSLEDQQLLAQFRPRVFISPTGSPPVDFYAFYLPHTVLKHEHAIVTVSPTREDLKRSERSFGHYLDFQGDPFVCRGAACQGYRGVLYGRVLRETMLFTDPVHPDTVIQRKYIILKYNAVFPTSGLPAKIPWYKEWGARIIGDPNMWHELDIHGAIFLFVNEAQGRPEILMLAQHMYFHSYLIGRDVQWPQDGRIKVAYAERSNEPYPYPPTRTQTHRAIGNFSNLSHLIENRGSVWDGGEDVVYSLVGGAQEIDYDLHFLPSRDPLYVSWIPLGEQILIWGMIPTFARSGPPGMDMHTLQNLQWAQLAQFWYFQEDDADTAELYRSSVAGVYDNNPTPVINYNAEKLWRDLQQHGM